MNSKLLTRIINMEKRAGASDVIGIRQAGYKQVEINGSGEVLQDTDAFFTKYPGGALITIEYANSPADIVVRLMDTD